MPKRTEPKFKLPPIRPENENLKGDTSVGKCENTISIPKDNVRLNPELDFIVEQRRREELAEILKRKRFNAEFLRHRLQMQWKQLEHNEHNFQRTIISHNRFLKRNLEKRERALAKILTDMELTRKREKEIKALDKSYDFFNAILNKMRLEIRNHSIYENYLNSVLELTDSPYKSNLEFLTKYESLQHVKEHCVKRQNAEMATTVLLHDDNVEFFRLQDIVLIVLMKPVSDPNWKLPNIPLKKRNPKLHQISTPLPTIHLPKDIARRDSSLMYLHVKTRLDKLDDQLVIRRIRCKQMANKLVGKWKELESCEHRLRSLVITHSKFVRNNLEKRMRANARLEQNQQLQRSRQADIAALKKEMDVAQFLMAEFKREINKHDIYDVFLTKVVENEESPYRTVNDLLSRYELLEYVKENRVEEQKTESFMVIKVHQNLKEMIQSGKVILIGLRNELNNLRCQFDDVCRRNLATETLITSIVNKTNELTAEVSSCQYMIDAIYRYICYRRRIPQGDYALREVKPKIDTLKSTLGVWAEILATSELSKRKKSLKNVRKSQPWKPSLGQSFFMWKKKPSTKLSTSPLSDNGKKGPSINKIG